jgi:hypothetical protein
MTGGSSQLQATRQCSGDCCMVVLKAGGRRCAPHTVRPAQGLRMVARSVAGRYGCTVHDTYQLIGLRIVIGPIGSG